MAHVGSPPTDTDSALKVVFFFNKAQDAESTRSIFAKFHIQKHSERNPPSAQSSDTIVPAKQTELRERGRAEKNRSHTPQWRGGGRRPPPAAEPYMTRPPGPASGRGEASPKSSLGVKGFDAQTPQVQRPLKRQSGWAPSSLGGEGGGLS